MSMGSSGGGTSQTTTQMPKWVTPYAQGFLTDVNYDVNSMLNAGMPWDMQTGLSMERNQINPAQNQLNQNATDVARMAHQNPAMNPYLNQYYKAAALPYKQQF